MAESGVQPNGKVLQTAGESQPSIREPIGRWEELRERAHHTRSTIDQLQRKLQEKEIELEALQKELELQKIETGHWENRAFKLLEKHKTIDAEDYDSVKSELEQLQETCQSYGLIASQRKKLQGNIMSYLNSVFSVRETKLDTAPVSGGGLSENQKFSYGYASSPGKRSSMEDFFETQICGVDGQIIGLFGVFDGHGGARAAEYVKQNLFLNLRNHPKFISDTKLAIADAFKQTDSDFLKAENNQHRDAGSTASTAVLVGNRLLVANVGDSRAVLSRSGKAFPLSRDHKPNQTDERQRIEEAGGFVMWAGTWRVGGVLAVSRAFGDRLLKQYVVAEPEIEEEVVTDGVEFLILASDGLWDVVSNQDAVAMIQSIEDPEHAAKRLTEEAYRKGSADNITCVVVRFHHK